MTWQPPKEIAIYEIMWVCKRCGLVQLTNDLTTPSVLPYTVQCESQHEWFPVQVTEKDVGK